MAKIPAQSKPKTAGKTRVVVGGVTRRLGLGKPKQRHGG